MNKKMEMALKKSRLICSCIFILFAGCKKSSDIYLESYVVSKEEELLSEISSDKNVEELVSEKMGEDNVEAMEWTEVSTESEKIIYVYVCGAVMKPNVYTLQEGSRICDAIEIAGGLREDADALSVNLAKPVYDGQMLRVYTQEETAAGIGMKDKEDRNTDREFFYEEGSVSGALDKININTATRSQLMTLPGIGSAKADAILAYRESQGSFESIEDLMKIPGIKEGIFEQLKEQISIN